MTTRRKKRVVVMLFPKCHCKEPSTPHDCRLERLILSPWVHKVQYARRRGDPAGVFSTTSPGYIDKSMSFLMPDIGDVYPVHGAQSKLPALDAAGVNLAGARLGMAKNRHDLIL